MTRASVLLIVCAVFPAISAAVDLTWDGGAGTNDWYTANNWNPNLSPDSSYNLTVLFGAPETMDDIFTTAGGSITISGPGTTVSSGGLVYVAISGDTGSLSVQNGAALSSLAGAIGLFSAAGTATVTGTGSAWTNSGSLYVEGTSTLNIQDGGSVSNTMANVGVSTGSAASVTVDGAGSNWTSSSFVYVGYDDAAGTLAISDGAAVSVAGLLRIRGAGTLTLDGGTVHTQGFSVMLGGTFNFPGGTLTVDGGWFSPAAEMFVLDGAGSPTLNLTNGATADLSDALTIAESNTGHLSVSGGSSLSNTAAMLGYMDGSSGTAAVDGPGSSWTNSGSLYVGGDGDGTLNIQNGGAVSNVDGFIGAYGGGDSEGSVTVDGADSTWSSTGSLYVGGHTAEPGGSGALTVSDGGAVTVAGTLKVWPAGTVALDGGQVAAVFVYNEGTISGVGEVQAAGLSNSGTVSPGLSAGTMTIDGNFAQAAAGTLKIELAGSADHDVLEVTRAANLDGALTVLLIDGFCCSYGQEFTILTAGGGVTGEFSSVSGPVLDVTCGPFSVVITTTAMGDATLDGCVDGGDYTLWADNYGQPGAWCDGDFNCEGFVDGADYTLWADNYGYGTGRAGVPEPAALSMLILGAWLALRRKLRLAGQ